MNIITEADKEKLLVLAGKRLEAMLSENAGVPTLLLLAGGSSFSYLKHVDSKALRNNLTIGMSDDRYVSDLKSSNFNQLTETEFYSRAQSAGCAFLDSRTDAKESLEQFGERFGKNIQTWIENNPDGKVIATFGIGENRHTAGIMPYPEDPALFSGLFEGRNLFIAYDAGNKDPFSERTTITLTFIRKYIKNRMIFATGENKRIAIEAMLAKEGTFAETPARIHLEDSECVLFTDIGI